MTVFSKHNYEDDGGSIMKAARKQEYIMFPAPISFLDDELKAELGMKATKEKEEETSDAFCSLKVPIDHEGKDSKTYTMKVKRYDSGSLEEFLKCRLILAEQVKNNGDTDSPDNIMNLAQAMLAGRSLEAFLNEKRSQETKNRVQKTKTLTEHTPKHIYDLAIFEFSIRAFDIQSGWRDAYERQREYTRRDLFMENLNPSKFSQRLQDLNRYLDLIPIEKTSDSLKITKAYGNSLPEGEINSIMGHAIPPEWTVNLLALGKEPWRFKDLEDQLNMYRQQWQADQQKQIIAQMAGKIPNKSNDGKRKNSDRNHQNSNGGRGSNRNGNTARGGRGRGRGGRGGRGNNSEHLQNVECFNCGKKGHYSTDCSLTRKNNNERSNMVSKEDFKNLFQSSMKEMLTKKDKQVKNNNEGDDDSLDMNVFEKLMEGKQPMFVNKINDDLISINDTDTLDYSMQDNCTHGSIKHNDYNDDYDELAYPLGKRIKLKHEP
jgi:hypothetical protein